MSAYFWSDHNQLYPAKYTRFVSSIFSSLPIFSGCFSQFVADTSLSHSPPWGDQAVEGHGAQMSSPELPLLPKEGCSPLEQGNQGKSKNLSKLVLFLTMTTEKSTKNQLFQRLLRTGFYFGQCMVKVLLVFCCKEWFWCSVVIFWLEHQHFSGLKHWNMCRNQFITARRVTEASHNMPEGAETAGLHKALGLLFPSALKWVLPTQHRE